MTVIRAGLFILALIGTVVPFKLAQFLLETLYAPDTTGLPIPVYAGIGAYSLATVVALAVIVVCYRAIINDREKSDVQDGLEDNEDLPS